MKESLIIGLFQYYLSVRLKETLRNTADGRFTRTNEKTSGWGMRILMMLIIMPPCVAAIDNVVNRIYRYF